MATENIFKGVVYLSEDEYKTLAQDGTLTKDGTTINYEPESTLYITPKDDSGGIEEETDPTVPEHVKSITQENIEDWNAKLDTKQQNDAGTEFAKVSYYNSRSQGKEIGIGVFNNDSATPTISSIAMNKGTMLNTGINQIALFGSNGAGTLAGIGVSSDSGLVSMNSMDGSKGDIEGIPVDSALELEGDVVTLWTDNEDGSQFYLANKNQQAGLILKSYHSSQPFDLPSEDGQTAAGLILKKDGLELKTYSYSGVASGITIDTNSITIDSPNTNIRGYVPETRKINGKPLSDDINIDVPTAEEKESWNNKVDQSVLDEYIPKTDIKTLSEVSDIGYANPADRNKVPSVEAISWWNGAYMDEHSNLKYFQGGEIAGKTDIPRPLWLADSITLNDAGIEADYTIPKKNISPLVATGYTIQASDKIMFATEKATYLGIIKSANGDDVVATAKFDMATVGYADKLDTSIKAAQTDITGIQGKIPTQATADNQLADKNFVNSSINNLAAYYITKDAEGNPFATNAELLAASTFYNGANPRVPTTNDYAIIQADETKQDELGNSPTTRYSYQGGTYPNGQWSFQYIVNKTPFTAAQIAAINSNITAALTTQITTNKNDIAKKANQTDLASLTTRVTDVETKNTNQDTAIKKAQDTADGAVTRNTEQDSRLSNIESGYIKSITFNEEDEDTTVVELNDNKNGIKKISFGFALDKKIEGDELKVAANTVQELALSAYTIASEKVSKSGDTMSGNLLINDGDQVYANKKDSFTGDVNTLTVPGQYGVASNSTNIPIAQAGILYVANYSTGQWCQQTYVTNPDEGNIRVYRRGALNAASTSWCQWYQTYPNNNENTEVIFDMNDSNKNFGFASGLTCGSSIDYDFSKYRYLLIYGTLMGAESHIIYSPANRKNNDFTMMALGSALKSIYILKGQILASNQKLQLIGYSNFTYSSTDQKITADFGRSNENSYIHKIEGIK